MDEASNKLDQLNPPKRILYGREIMPIILLLPRVIALVGALSALITL